MVDHRDDDAEFEFLVEGFESNAEWPKTFTPELEFWWEDMTEKQLERCKMKHFWWEDMTEKQSKRCKNGKRLKSAAHSATKAKLKLVHLQDRQKQADELHGFRLARRHLAMARHRAMEEKRHEEVCKSRERGMTCKSREMAMKASMASIGLFADYAGTPGAEYLDQSEPKLMGADPADVRSIFNQLGVAPGGCFKFISTVVLEHDERQILINELDSSCGNAVDFKLPLTGQQLAQLIGPAVVERLIEFLPHGFDQIYLRRCSAYGKSIRFHVDEALWTMQVPLNDPEDYQGGRLVYATSDGHLDCPHRAAGTATVHDAAMLHGVTKLLSGVRYGLYFLQLRSET